MFCRKCGHQIKLEFSDILGVLAAQKGAVYNGLSHDQINILVKKLEMAGIKRPFKDKDIKRIEIKD